MPDREIDEDAPIFAIAVAAELAGMHPQTLRQYDRIGLVVHDIDEHGITSRTLFLDEDGAENLTIDPHLSEIYPPPAAHQLVPA